MAVVLFWPVLFSPLVVTWPNINTTVCSGACDKHVSFLYIVFVSEEYSRELIKGINVISRLSWYVLNHRKALI